MALDNTAALLELPELVRHEILCRLPTKIVVNFSFLSKQWENILSSSYALDFVEGFDKSKPFKVQRHWTFINVLKKSLSILQTRKHERELDKFRLCMTNYERREDDVIVSKWLSYSLTRSVKEIDINLKSQPLRESINCYSLSMTNFANASRSLTSLNLEYVKLISIIDKSRKRTDARQFPSLKKMSFKNVFFESAAVNDMLHESPAVETLSFVSCTFEYYSDFASSTLKFLVITDCNAPSVTIRSALKLESVRVVSNKHLRSLDLVECYNLKSINVYGNGRLELFHVDGCNDDVDGTIRAPYLKFFTYEGCLNSRFSLKSPKLRATFIKQWDNWDGEASFDPLKHFLKKLKDFLGTFRNSEHVKLNVSDYKMLAFPEDFSVEIDIA